MPAKLKLILLESDPLTIARLTRIASRFCDVVLQRELERAISVVASETSVSVIVAGSSPRWGSALTPLERVKAIRPDVLRVMLVDNSDLAAVVAGLHSGIVERTIHKPVTEADILAAIPPHWGMGAVARMSRSRTAAHSEVWGGIST